MRKFATLATAAVAVAGFVLSATPVQAAVITCPIPTSGPILCLVDPGLRPLAATATHLNVLGTRELGTTVRATGTVKNLLSGANGNQSGTVELWFRRDLAAGGQNPSVLIGRYPVTTAGSFSVPFKALHSGSVQMRYLGKASTTTTNGRASSRSAWVHLTVVKTGTRTLINLFTPRSLTDYQTPRVAFDESRPVTVKVTALCVAAEHNLRVSLVSPGLLPVTHSVNPNDTDFVWSTTFAASDGLHAPGYATAVRVQTQRDCSAGITASQQLVTTIF